MDMKIIKKRTSRVAYCVEPDPLKIYKRLKNMGKGFLFESADRCGVVGRYSLIGVNPVLEVKALGTRVTLEYGDQAQVFEEDPFKIIKKILGGNGTQKNRKSSQEGDCELPFSQGGLAGYIGYDAIRHIENIGGQLVQTSHDPDDLHLFLPQHLLVIDREDKCLHVIEFGLTPIDENVQDDETSLNVEEGCCDKGAVPFMKRLEKILEEEVKETRDSVLEDQIKIRENGALELSEKWRSDLKQKDFQGFVMTAKDHIARGDAFQIVFSRRLEKETSLTGLEVYKTLRRLNPSPYMFIVSTGKSEIVGASPETMVNMKSGTATIHPIAGTRPRGKDKQEDMANEKALKCDVKENAEHLMLVDLARNDIGRISIPGTVTVPKFKTIERFSHVMHIVSEVTGQVQEGMDAVDVFKACFPAGTVSGAPKVKAMSILAENERVKRGIYAGAVGWIGRDGNMDTCIAIRTAVLRGGRIEVQAGGGIVKDSDPEMEFMETIHKSASIMRAVELAEGLKK